MKQHPYLLLIRHAQSEANARKLISGALEVPLSPLGREQASHLQHLLPDFGIEEVITSAQRRAKQTADLALGDWYSSARREHEDMNERRWGILEGVPVRIHKAMLELKEIPHDSFIPDDGESLDDLKRRVKRFSSQVSSIKRNTAVFAHHSSLKALLCALMPDDFSEWTAFGIPNATPVLLTFRENRYELDSRSRQLLFASDANTKVNHKEFSLSPQPSRN